MKKNRCYSKQIDLQSENKRIILESCMIKFLQICSTMYNNNIENPFPEKTPNNIDPFSLMDGVNRLKLILENIHAALTGHEEQQAKRQVKRHKRKQIRKLAQIKV